MTLIGYARVSTADDRQTTDLQIDALRGAGVAHNNIFQDHASGADTHRPGLDAALSRCGAGDTLVVWKLDRLGRNLAHLVTILEHLRSQRVHIKSLTEAVVAGGAMGDMMGGMLAVLAQYERALISERVRAGLVAARARGRIGGRPSAISDEALTWAATAIENGQSVSAAAREIGASRTTLIGALRRRAGGV